jgi:predicted metal-binding membrane protein
MEMILRRSTDRPRLFMALCLAVIVSVSGLTLWISAGASLEGLAGALCGPAANTGPAQLLAMWMAMTLAMMIPTAAPMIATYLDIAEAAAGKRMAIVSPLVLAAGFGAVWLIFAFAAALAQWMVLESGHAGAFQGRFAGLGLIAAGAYQFTALKHACLSKCRMPMPYFLAHWTDRPMGVFRMGLDQGLNCFGCCWALMSLSFAAGLMNLVWMGFVGAMMVLEKTLPQPKALTYGLGLGLIGAGACLIVV